VYNRRYYAVIELSEVFLMYSPGKDILESLGLSPLISATG
ncbi:uncharacterized protein METZ01_LOCUS497981, partial [marine metagenome]